MIKDFNDVLRDFNIQVDIRHQDDKIIELNAFIPCFNKRLLTSFYSRSQGISKLDYRISDEEAIAGMIIEKFELVKWVGSDISYNRITMTLDSKEFEHIDDIK